MTEITKGKDVWNAGVRLFHRHGARGGRPFTALLLQASVVQRSGPVLLGPLLSGRQEAMWVRYTVPLLFPSFNSDRSHMNCLAPTRINLQVVSNYSGTRCPVHCKTNSNNDTYRHGHECFNVSMSAVSCYCWDLIAACQKNEASSVRMAHNYCIVSTVIVQVARVWAQQCLWYSRFCRMPYLITCVKLTSAWGIKQWVIRLATSLATSSPQESYGDLRYSKRNICVGTCVHLSSSKRR